MELLCIETHPKKAVLAGRIYPLINDLSPCKCDVVDVGIKWPSYLKKAFFVECRFCGVVFPFDNVWWLFKSRFIPIGTQDELENYKLSEPALK